MIRLRLSRPDRPSQELVFESNVATIGRGGECDLVVDSPLVGTRHAVVFCGVVVVDLGSSGGTWIDGHRIEAAVPYHGGVVCLGDESIRLEIEVEERPHGAHGASAGEAGPPRDATASDPSRASAGDVPRGADAAGRFAHAAPNEAARTAVEPGRATVEPAALELALVRAELERTRERASVHDDEIERLRILVRESKDAAEARESDLEADKADLRRRLDTLREEVESREVEASSALQVRLARARQEELAAEGDKLRARIAELELSALHVAGGRVEPASAARLERLETSLRESEASVRRLTSELERARGAAPSPTSASNLFERLQSENAALRRELAQARVAERAAAPLPAELFGALRGENEALQRRVLELERLEADRASGDPRALLEGRAGLEREIVELREKLERAEARQAPRLQGHVALGVAELFELAESDAPDRAALDAERWIVASSLGFLARVERILVRLVASYAQIRTTETRLPGSERSFRRAAQALLRADGAAGRRELEQQLEELGAWLTVSIAAPRQAAERFAHALKDELSERRLVERDPIPAVRRLAGQAEGELWRRTSARLADLTTESIEDRLEALTRACAHELREAARSG